MTTPKKPLSYRNESLAAGATVFVVLKTAVIQDAWVTAFFSAIGVVAASNSIGFMVMRAAVDACSLVLLIALFERVILFRKTRAIRGEWVYHSSSGTWGYVRICLEGTHLRYYVDLYDSREALRRAVVARLSTVSIGSGTDRLIVFSDGVYSIWYHIPPTRAGSITYAERHGLLTLRPKGMEGTFTGSWERTGCLAISVDPAEKPAVAGPIISEARLEHASGSFLFFMRKADFIREESLTPVME